jgi:hypothetical protein
MSIRLFAARQAEAVSGCGVCWVNSTIWSLAHASPHHTCTSSQETQSSVTYIHLISIVRVAGLHHSHV